jgi:hypothetical protein
VPLAGLPLFLGAGKGAVHALTRAATADAGAAVLIRRLPPGAAPVPGQIELVDTAVASESYDLLHPAPAPAPARTPCSPPASAATWPAR